MHYGGIALGVAILIAIILVLCLSFVCMLEATVLQLLFFLQEEESRHLQESSKGKRKLALVAWTLTPRLCEGEDLRF